MRENVKGYDGWVIFTKDIKHTELISLLCGTFVAHTASI